MRDLATWRAIYSFARGLILAVKDYPLTQQALLYPCVVSAICLEAIKMFVQPVPVT